MKDEKPDGPDDPAVDAVETNEANEPADDLTDGPVETSGEGQAAHEAGGAAGQGDASVPGSEDETRRARPASRRRGAAFAVLRAAVVLVGAAVAFQLVVPTVDVVRTRLARLVPTRTGVAAYDKAKPQAGQQPDTQTGIAALTTAAKRSPNQTGLYSIEWSPTDSSGAGVIAFMLPSDSAARAALSQIRTQQLSAGSYSSDSLTRVVSYAVPGIPGSYASLYRPPAKNAGSVPSLAVTAFRYGHVVAVSEAASPGSAARPAANTITAREYDTLRRLGPGFSLSVTRYPVVATILWIVGALSLAALVALVPVARRRRVQRRLRAYQEEMAHRVVVGRQVIVKHRR